jgi:precorrin-4 C11-methyltransferase
MGATPVITTASDVQGLWALDTLGREYEWSLEPCFTTKLNTLNAFLARFVDRAKTALLLETRDPETRRMIQTKPDFVDIYTSYEAIEFSGYELFIAVSPKRYAPPVPALFYRPKVLCVGLGCEKNIPPNEFILSFKQNFNTLGYAVSSIKTLGSADLKASEPAFLELARELNAGFNTFSNEELNRVQSVPNPSKVVFNKIGVYSVSEAASACLAGEEHWLVEKQKCAIETLPKESPRHYTLAISQLKGTARKGHIAIVGAGPGDPELITLKGKAYLQEADLVLYAGSLVPEELTHYASDGALVKSSADLSLEEQFELMKQFYDRGQFVVRLHTGDPCIYGAIQEQMSYFDQHNMSYEIVPGVSSFQAAAAQLKSEFTIPEHVQTIILTRGSGRTPVPEKEELSKLARSQSTMCIYLSATLAGKVQAQLLEHYAPETPVAVCYKLTWKDQKIWQGQLSDLAKLVKESGKTRTVLIVVGQAILSRGERSKLYDPTFSHGFREANQSEPPA